MQDTSEGGLRTKMEELRLICDREIPIQQQRMDSVVVSFRKSLESVKAKAQETVQNQANLAKLKTQLREVEDDLVKALAVKTRNEAKQMASADSVASTKARVEELQRVLQDQKARKDEYATIISEKTEDMKAFEEKCDKDNNSKREIEEAMSWYNRVLGFRIECGHGVKFIFTNINVKNPEEEYSFTIRHENDTYTLLDCDPPVNNTNELIYDLNKSNGLFKFVRTMRAKFQEAVVFGNRPQVSSLDHDSSMISPSAPVSSVSTDNRSESLAKETYISSEKSRRHFKKINQDKESKAISTPIAAALSLRRSPRFKVEK